MAVPDCFKISWSGRPWGAGHGRHHSGMARHSTKLFRSLGSRCPSSSPARGEQTEPSGIHCCILSLKTSHRNKNAADCVCVVVVEREGWAAGEISQLWRGLGAFHINNSSALCCFKIKTVLASLSKSAFTYFFILVYFLADHPNAKLFKS